MQLIFVNFWLKDRRMIERFPVSAQDSLKKRQVLFLIMVTAAETEQTSGQVSKSHDLHLVGCSI